MLDVLLMGFILGYVACLIFGLFSNQKDSIADSSQINTASQEVISERRYRRPKTRGWPSLVHNLSTLELLMSIDKLKAEIREDERDNNN